MPTVLDLCKTREEKHHQIIALVKNIKEHQHYTDDNFLAYTKLESEIFALDRMIRSQIDEEYEEIKNLYSSAIDNLSKNLCF